MWEYRYADELYHFGTKGMKWGVKRYQNKDGSLTAKGERRYYNEDGSLTRHGKSAVKARSLSRDVQEEHLAKLHDSKPKKPDDPNVNYFSYDKQYSRGRKYVKQLSKEILNGTVTSFVEKSNGKRTNVKTKKGVVIRDKDGNRVSAYDYDKAQNIVRRYYGYRIRTGDWS